MSTSRASSTWSENVDLELVEQIIERAPRSATSFPLVYRAYGEVLEAQWVALVWASNRSRAIVLTGAVISRHLAIPPTTSFCSNSGSSEHPPGGRDGISGKLPTCNQRLPPLTVFKRISSPGHRATVLCALESRS
jgi:hypothetical protein